MTDSLFLILLPVLINLFAGTWILAKRPGMTTNRCFFILTGLLVVWGTFDFLQISATTHDQIIAASRVGQFAGLLIPVCCFVFLRAFVEETLNLRYGLYSWTFAFLVLGTVAWGLTNIGSELIIAGARFGPGYPDIVRGPLHGTFMLWIVLWVAILHGVVLLRGIARARTEQGLRLLVMGAAPLVTVVAFTVLEIVYPLVSGGERMISYPATIAFTLSLSGASWHLKIFSLTPESMARQILDEFADGIALIDPAGEIRFANSAFRRLVGPVRDMADLRSRIHPDKSGPSIPDDWYGDPRDTVDMVGRVEDGDDGFLPVLLRVRKCRDAYGANKGLLFTIRDRRPVERMTRLQGLSKVVTAVSHHLNNPLTVVLGFSELGAQDVNAPEKTRRQFARIQEQTLRARQVLMALSSLAARAEDPSASWIGEDLLAEIEAIVSAGPATKPIVETGPPNEAGTRTTLSNLVIEELRKRAT